MLAHAWGRRHTTAPVLHALAATMLLLESLGHQVDEAKIDLGLGWEDYVHANARLWSANLTASVDEMAAALGRPIDSTTLEPVTLASYHYGRQVSAAQFITALSMRNRVSRSLAAFFDSHDVLLTPTVPE